MIDLPMLNTRLAAHQLPVQTAASLAALPMGIDVARIEHALHQAENGQKGALVFLARHLPDPAAGPTPTSAPEATRPPPSAPPAASAPPSARSAMPAAASAPPAVPTSATPVKPHTPPPPPAAPVNSPPETGASAPAAARDRVQCRVYGGKAALCVETDVTRQDEPTLRIEAALATAPRTYDWGQKITVQLTREELPEVIATLLGFLHRCECRNHGPNHDKGVDIEHQGQHLFIRVFQKGQAVRALPVGSADSYYLAALGLRQLRQATPWLSDQGVLAALKLTVQRMATAAPPGAQRAA